METNEVVLQPNNDPSTTVNSSTINTQQLILNHSTSSTQQEQPMSILSFHSASMCAKGPSCIVIGCKNGQTNSSVKYYQVPFLSNTNNIARQWYINTLREDLLESQLRNPLQNQIIHYVCIEHFDEESFLIANHMLDEQEQIMVLKEDAVPSLFEIEVFQKMIHYQEQLASNNVSSAANTLTVTNVSSNVVDSPSSRISPPLSTTNQAKSFIQNAFSQHPATIQPPSSFHSESNISNMLFNGEQINASKMTSKRTRIDPEVRAALIQRVPKAVKRTAAPIVPTSTVQTSTAPQKAQKAVKHTMPSILTTNQAQMQAAKPTESTSAIKQPKAVKRTNSFLKEMLPPPIMQSTKRPSVNKAIKHTGGAPHSYYQNQVTPILNSTNGNTTTLSNITSSSLNTTNSNATSNASNNANLINVPLNNQTNKLTITTTYVYKRIAQPPEIDLSLECEEEELIYVKPPVSAPVTKAPSDENTCAKFEPIETIKSSPAPTASPSSPQPQPQPQPASTTSTMQTEIKSNEEENAKSKEKENEKDKVNSKSNADEIKAEPIEHKSKPSRNEIDSESSEKTTRVKEIESIKPMSKKQQPSTKQQSSTSTMIAASGKQASTKSSDYTNILFKYYSRRQGELATTSSHQSRRAKIVNMPADMRPGNYPVKCHVCGLILENNIELTSHICSHLESDSNTTNVYISPFDAVTTTCALCNLTFRQPFELIKHLDLKHMKELNEYKCRICERQHAKLSELIAHLNRTHSHQEMPYKCDACGFRTSFYADAIYHIKEEHTSTLRHFCPYCLKSIVLPYNKKLGHVQSNMFYAHLITHFNKQENDVLMPSQCKHCQKCILHVRYMQDHLMHDHTCNADENEEEQEEGHEEQEGENGEENDEQVEVLSKSRRRMSRANSEQTKVAGTHKSTQKMGRKRRVTNDLDEKVKDMDNASSDVDSNQLEEDDSSQTRATIRKRKRSNRNSMAKEIKSEDEEKDVDAVSQSNSDMDESKWRKKSKSKRTGRKSTASSAHESIIPNTYMRKQKALKQTNVKKVGRRSTARTISLENNNLIYNDIDTSMFSAQGEEILSALLIGNLRFYCLKREFKCIECNETELRNHFNNEYTCHQCFYNTNCSKSFEFHLHGHLDKKRVALWNKKLQPQTELYKCACGFQVQSSKQDSYLNADVGNRVASHLLKCEHKCVKYEEKECEEDKMETEENSNRNSEATL